MIMAADSGNVVVNWFSSNIDSLLISMANGAINLFINPIIVCIGNAFQWAVSFLPDRPTQSFDITTVLDSTFLAYLNWFIPFDALQPAFVTVFTAVTIRYCFFPILRWFKLVK